MTRAYATNTIRGIYMACSLPKPLPRIPKPYQRPENIRIRISERQP